MRLTAATLHVVVASLLGAAACSSSSNVNETSDASGGNLGGPDGAAPSKDAGGVRGDGGMGAGSDTGAPGDRDGGKDAGDGDSAAVTADGSIPSSTCTKYACSTSAEEGQCASGDYLVRNDMWNTSETLGPQTIYVCSSSSWYVVSSQIDQGGAILTYPDVQLNYGSGNGTPMSTFHSIASTFSETSPHVGDYEDAYDIWINGFGDGHTELMIWVDNFNQVPGGSKVTTATFDGRTYDVWRSPGSAGQYLAFVATTNFTSGTLDLLAIFNWTISQGWIASDSTLTQIGFGVEIAYTGGAPATWYFDDFSITSK
jgi:hypothetical protein